MRSEWCVWANCRSLVFCDTGPLRASQCCRGDRFHVGGLRDTRKVVFCSARCRFYASSLHCISQHPPPKDGGVVGGQQSHHRRAMPQPTSSPSHKSSMRRASEQSSRDVMLPTRRTSRTPRMAAARSGVVWVFHSNHLPLLQCQPPWPCCLLQLASRLACGRSAVSGSLRSTESREKLEARGGGR